MPDPTLRYSVVVPVFNEAANIGAFCEKALAELSPNFELLICYDFEQDSTLPALAGLPPEKKPTTLRLIRNSLGRGVRYAIEAGMRAAATPIVVVMMADLSDDFPKVDEIVRRCEAGADVVCPSRYMRGGKQIGGPWLKGMMSRCAGLSLYYVAGLPTHDPTNSFKAYRKSFLETHPIESTAGFCLGLELTVKCHFTGGRVEEVPATWYDRTAGESRFQLRKWLPMYLHWYRYGMDKSRRAQLIMLGLISLFSVALGLALIHLRPDQSYTAGFITGEDGNQLYRADKILHGFLPYRDFALQYGFIPVYVSSAFAWVLGNTMATNRIFHLAMSVVCIAMLYMVLRRTIDTILSLGLTLLFLPVFLCTGSELGSYLGVEYLSLERMCLLAIMLVWLPPERSWIRAIALGVILGVWQETKFGGAFFAGAAIIAADLLWICCKPAARRMIGRWFQSLVLTLAAFVVLELLWIGLIGSISPHQTAIEALWPAYILPGYDLGTQLRYPHLEGMRTFIGAQWIRLACGILSSFGIIVWVRRNYRTQSTSPDLLLFISPLFFFIACHFYLRHQWLWYQFSWTLIPGACWCLVRMPWTAFAPLILSWLPTWLVVLKIAVGSNPGVGRFVLPDNEIIYVTPIVRSAFNSYAKVAGKADADGRFVLALMNWGGGGFHFYFDKNYALRNYLLDPVAFRDEDRAELRAKLKQVGVVVGIGRPSNERWRKILGDDTAAELATDFRQIPSDSENLVMIRK